MIAFILLSNYLYRLIIKGVHIYIIKHVAVGRVASFRSEKFKVYELPALPF